MCKKSPPVAYYVTKLRTVARSVLKAELEDAPLTKTDRAFILDIYEGLSYFELSQKYNKTTSGIAQWKRRLCQKMLRHDLSKRSLL